MDQEELDARVLVEKYKDQVKSEVTAGYVKELAGNIIGYALAGSRQRLRETLEREAADAYKTQNYETALDRFCHFLALIETDPNTTVADEMHATITSNVGACCHQLGLTDTAIEYYERALQEFKALPFKLINRLSPQRLVFGNLIDKRIEYVEKKLACIRAGEAPDPATYQDGFGRERKWTQTEMDGKKTVWTWLLEGPRGWFGYGKIDEVRVSAAVGPGSAAVGHSQA